MQSILLNVKGSMQQNGQTEETEFFTLGSMQLQGEKKVFSYPGAMGSEDLTEITVENDTVIMKKQESGAQDAAIVVLKERKMYSSYYSTPLGLVNVEVYPTLVNVTETEGKGEIELEYITRIADPQSLNRLRVNYMEQN